MMVVATLFINFLAPAPQTGKIFGGSGPIVSSWRQGVEPGGDSQTEVSVASSKASSKSGVSALVQPTDSISRAASPDLSEVSGPVGRGRSLLHKGPAVTSLSKTAQRPFLGGKSASVVSMKVIPPTPAKTSGTQAKQTSEVRQA